MDFRYVRTACIGLTAAIAMGAVVLSSATDSLAAKSPSSTASAMAKADPAEKAKSQFAAQTAKYGMDNKDPYALVSAANMIMGLKSKVVVLESGNAGNKNAPGYDPVSLLKAAKTLAAADADLSKAIDAKLAQAGKGQGYWVNGTYVYVCDYYWEYGAYGWGWYWDCL